MTLYQSICMIRVKKSGDNFKECHVEYFNPPYFEKTVTNIAQRAQRGSSSDQMLRSLILKMKLKNRLD